MIFKTIVDCRLEFAKRLKERRISGNMTQASLAQKSGLNINTIRRMEATGEGSISSLLHILQSFKELDSFGQILKQEPVVDIISPKPSKKRVRASGK